MLPLLSLPSYIDSLEMQWLTGKLEMQWVTEKSPKVNLNKEQYINAEISFL
jgi:hypothetical protein